MVHCINEYASPGVGTSQKNNAISAGEKQKRESKIKVYYLGFEYRHGYLKYKTKVHALDRMVIV